MQNSKQRPRRENATLTSQFNGPEIRELLQLYLSEARGGNTRAARHLLELYRRHLLQRLSPDDHLALYVVELVARVVNVKDRRDAEGVASGKLGNEHAYYRDLAKALNFVEPVGRRKRTESAIDKAILVAHQMADGRTLEESVAEVQDRHHQCGAKDAYARHRSAARADVDLKKRGKR